MTHTLATQYPLGTRVTVTRNGRDYRGTVTGYATRGPYSSHDGIHVTYHIHGTTTHTTTAIPEFDTITTR